MRAAGTFQLGPENASLQVKTYREGVGAKVGHDLVIDVTRWEATVDLADDPAGSSIRLTADPRSLEVREGLRGLKPLTAKDRAEIVETIDAKVLGGSAISFTSRSVRGGAGADHAGEEARSATGSIAADDRARHQTRRQS